MKDIKVGISLIILGNLMYLANIFFVKNPTSDAMQFFSGFLLGSSIAINIVGIVLTIYHIAKNNKKENK